MLTLSANGRKVGEGRVARTVLGLYSAFEGQDIDIDNGTPVDDGYTPPFQFPGKRPGLLLSWRDTMRTRTTLTAAALLAVGVLIGWKVHADDKLTPAEAKAIAQEGYLFGLPPVYIALEADVLTNVAKPEPGRAPFNQFDHHREFPDARNNKIVGMNVDTLYSLAHLDLTAEPIVLVVPPMEGNRWWIMQIIDAWNDVPAAPGSRTHGGKGGNFALVGPTFKGTLPTGLEKISVDTSIVALGGRTYTGGKADYAAVHKIQDQYKLIPLSQWKGTGTNYTPSASVPVKPGVDAKTPIPAQVFKLSADQFFGRLCELLVNNPAREADAPIMARLAKLGIKPGAKFTTEAFDADTRKAIEEGIAAAQQAIRDEELKMGEMVNGWQIARDLGRYGTKYTYRAAWTFFAVGGNLVEDALYPLTWWIPTGRSSTARTNTSSNSRRSKFHRWTHSGR